MQAPLTHVWLAQAAAVLQTPEGLHVSTPFAAHSVAPGMHAAQAPLTHAGVLAEHAAAVPQLPVASHVRRPPAEHCVAPGVHTPAHAPELQRNGQPTKPPHWPLALHVSTPLFSHCVAP